MARLRAVAQAAAVCEREVVVVGRAKALAFDLKTLVPELLALTRGKGGGSADLVQSSAADAAAAAAAWRWATGVLGAKLGAPSSDTP